MEMAKVTPSRPRRRAASPGLPAEEWSAALKHGQGNKTIKKHKHTLYDQLKNIGRCVEGKSLESDSKKLKKKAKKKKTQPEKVALKGQNHWLPQELVIFMGPWLCTAYLQ
ncbi:hypothetical protein BS78_01G414100 [Paspalum vaginatum]|nr:hypothetical protein BS78_01G414100 [Paspalum vaginatum]